MKSILIIEDDRNYRRSMELILNLEGFVCRCFADGEAGLAAMREQRPDLILCDIMMPGLDGHGILNAIKSDPQLVDIPFIFVTALGDRSDQRRGMVSGADDYLIKPFTDEELLAAVIGRLNRHELIRMRQTPAVFQEELSILQKHVTPRELEVLVLVGHGVTSKEIANHLNISFKTVHAHRANLMRKLDAINAAHLSRWAVIAELLSGQTTLP